MRIWIIQRIDESRSQRPHWGVTFWTTTMLFLASALLTGVIGTWAADQVVLRYVYGQEVVRREQLRIMSHKPDLTVSNGDTLKGWSFSHFLISGVVWLPQCIGLLSLLFRLMPKEYRELAVSPRGFTGTQTPISFAVCLLSIVIFVISLFLLRDMLGRLVACAVVASIALALQWLTRKARPASPAGQMPGQETEPASDDEFASE